MGPVGGKTYRMIDGLGWEKEAGARATGVLYEPGLTRYLYESPEGEALSVTLQLRENRGGSVLSARASAASSFVLLLDMTPTNTWEEGSYSVRDGPDVMRIENSAVPLTLEVDAFTDASRVGANLEWRYKLGDGFRRRSGDSPVFIDHTRSPYVPAILNSGTGNLRIRIPLPAGQGIKGTGMQGPPRLGKGAIARAVQLRMRTLATYGLGGGDIWFPEAGSWWFRHPWLRDALEGIRWNLRTYRQLLNWGGRIRSLLVHLIGRTKESRGLPIILGKGGSFTSDAPPQLLSITARLAQMEEDSELLQRALDLAEFASDLLLAGDRFSDTVLRDSVLCSPANSSWIDSVVHRDGIRWPLRLPWDWRGAVAPFEPQFCLIEVNALYMEALDLLISSCDRMAITPADAVGELRRCLLKGYRKHLMVPGGLPALSAVPGVGLRDASAGSPAVVALAVLSPSLHPVEDVRRAWAEICAKLLVNRRVESLGDGTHAFGVLVREGPIEPYLGDEQYHGPTIWPRDTPYLIRLMDTIGQDACPLLINNLDHMVGEGVVGYCSELFSLPLGQNPASSFRSSNPVPVKNPAQYWSHWCDPYLEHAGELGLSI